jgi:osmotically-inducible protein OsmY
MARSASLLYLPARGHNNAEKIDRQKTSSLAIQSLEDLHLAECIARAFDVRGYRALCSVDITVRAGIVSLRGCVQSCYLKQVAQEIALQVPGVHEVQNHIRVVRQ